MQVLLVEDDRQTADFVAGRLRRSGHHVTHCGDAEEGFTALADARFDVVVLDRMLPGLDGLTAVQRMRHLGIRTPVLMLTALSEVANRTEGLFAGADDYLCKPFEIEELLARIHALARRSDAASTDQKLRVGDLALDRQGRRVTRAGEDVILVAKEYDVLEYLMLRAGEVVTRTMLLHDVWKLSFDPGTNIVESQISRLRAKLRESELGKLIHTTRGQGYVLRAP
jgi:two-component system, OmpR family, response regulator